VVSQTKDTPVSVVVDIHFLVYVFLIVTKNKPFELIDQKSILISNLDFHSRGVTGVLDNCDEVRKNLVTVIEVLELLIGWALLVVAPSDVNIHSSGTCLR
jgi:hypothetical protein